MAHPDAFRVLLFGALLSCFGPAMAQDQEGEDSGAGESPEAFIARREMEIADGDLAAHLELADLAASTGLIESRNFHGAKVLAADPKNRHAHEILGNTFYKKRWLTPDEARDAGLIEFRGEWLDPRLHQVHLEKSNWENAWEVDRDDIVLRTNTSMAKAEKYLHTFMQFKQDMQVTFGVKLDKKYKVNVYATKEEYHTIGEGPRGTGGFYSPGGRDFHFFDDPDFFQARRIFFHEGTHMFVNLTNKNKAFSYPNWLNEGMAEYFGGAKFDYEKDCYTFGHILNDRLEVIQGMVNSQSFQPLEEFIAKEDLDGAYDQGWALVLFIQKRDDGKYARSFGAFLNKLANAKYKMLEGESDGRRGKETLEIFKSLFLTPGQTMSEFEAEWVEFVKKLAPEPGAPDFRKMKSFH